MIVIEYFYGYIVCHLYLISSSRCRIKCKELEAGLFPLLAAICLLPELCRAKAFAISFPTAFAEKTSNA